MDFSLSRPMDCQTTLLFLTTVITLSGLLVSQVEGISRANCKEIYDAGMTSSGVYTITVNERDVMVYCNMTLRGGGWTVIQQRVNGNLAFNRTWQEYRDGFGELTSINFWLGLQNIRDITALSGSTFELYIGLESFHPTDVERFALYKSFSLASEAENYALNVGSLDRESDAGDSLVRHNKKQFSTPDQDNDTAPRKHCAKEFKAGWWFHNCHDSLLNGQWYAYGLLADLNVPDGIIWETWSGDRESLKATIMAVRPL